MARSTKLHTAAGSGATKQVLEMLSSGKPFDINARDDNTSTPLMLAVWGKGKSRMKLVQALIDAGAKIDARRSDGMTALAYAAIHGGTEIVQLLLDNGATVDLAIPNYNETALTYAVHTGRADTADTLLRNGANPRHRISPKHTDPVRSGKTAIEIAMSSRSHKLRSLLEPFGSRQTTSSRATSSEMVLEHIPADQSIKRLDAWLKTNRRDYHQQLKRGITKQSWGKFEKHIGCKLPVAMQQLYRWRDGQAGDNYEGFLCNLSFMSTSDIKSTCRDMRALLKSGDFDTDEFPNWWNPKWVPILDDGGGDHWCLDMQGCFGGKVGQIVLFEHETDTRDILFPSLDVMLELFVQGLEAGEWETCDGELNPKGDIPYWTGYPRGASAGDE